MPEKVNTGNTELHKYVTAETDGHVARMELSRNAYRILVGKSEGNIPLGKPRRRWEDNIKMDLRDVGCDAGDWIDYAQDKVQWWAYVRKVMNLRVP